MAMHDQLLPLTPDTALKSMDAKTRCGYPMTQEGFPASQAQNDTVKGCMDGMSDAHDKVQEHLGALSDSLGETEDGNHSQHEKHRTAARASLDQLEGHLRNARVALRQPGSY